MRPAFSLPETNIRGSAITEGLRVSSTVQWS